MRTYLSIHDRKGRKVQVHDTVRVFFPGASPIVGWVRSMTSSKITVEYPITDRSVVGDDGQPTGEFEALEVPERRQVTVPYTQVELWG
jgi:hypothetical protein